MKMISLFLSVLLLSICSCNDEQKDSIAVEFEFRLLNEQGIPSTSFNEGENFVFSFLIINNSNEGISLHSFDTEDFFKIVKMSDSDGTSSIELGKPYKSIFCEYIVGYPIAQKDTLRIERPWIIPDSIKNNIKEHYNNSILCGFEENAFLPEGIYKTAFNSSFNFIKNEETFSTSKKQFEINFKVH